MKIIQILLVGSLLILVGCSGNTKENYCKKKFETMCDDVKDIPSGYGKGRWGNLQRFICEYKQQEMIDSCIQNYKGDN